MPLSYPPPFSKCVLESGFCSILQSTYIHTRLYLLCLIIKIFYFILLKFAIPGLLVSTSKYWLLFFPFLCRLSGTFLPDLRRHLLKMWNLSVDVCPFWVPVAKQHGGSAEKKPLPRYILYKVFILSSWKKTMICSYR